MIEYGLSRDGLAGSARLQPQFCCDYKTSLKDTRLHKINVASHELYSVVLGVMSWDQEVEET